MPDRSPIGARWRDHPGTRWKGAQTWALADSSLAGSDLEHVLLLLGGQLIDLGNVGIGDVLDLLLCPVTVILRQPVVLEVLEQAQGVPPSVTNANPMLFGDLPDLFDELLAALFRQRRNLNPNDLAIVARREPQNRPSKEGSPLELRLTV